MHGEFYTMKVVLLLLQEFFIPTYGASGRPSYPAPVRGKEFERRERRAHNLLKIF